MNSDESNLPWFQFGVAEIGFAPICRHIIPTWLSRKFIFGSRLLDLNHCGKKSKSCVSVLLTFSLDIRCDHVSPRFFNRLAAA
jgi:hypothetical protein